MAYLGFVFEIFKGEKINFLAGEIIEKKHIVIFIKSENFVKLKNSQKIDFENTNSSNFSNKISKNIVVGLKERFKIEECQFFYLTENLKFEKFFVFENSTFKYMKISLNQRTIIDYEFLNAWFQIDKYKKLWELLSLDSSLKEEDIFLRIDGILNLFKLS